MLKRLPVDGSPNRDPPPSPTALPDAWEPWVTAMRWCKVEAEVIGRSFSILTKAAGAMFCLDSTSWPFAIQAYRMVSSSFSSQDVTSWRSSSRSSPSNKSERKTLNKSEPHLCPLLGDAARSTSEGFFKVELHPFSKEALAFCPSQGLGIRV